MGLFYRLGPPKHVSFYGVSKFDLEKKLWDLENRQIRPINGVTILLLLPHPGKLWYNPQVKLWGLGGWNLACTFLMGFPMDIFREILKFEFFPPKFAFFVIWDLEKFRLPGKKFGTTPRSNHSAYNDKIRHAPSWRGSLWIFFGKFENSNFSPKNCVFLWIWT